MADSSNSNARLRGHAAWALLTGMVAVPAMSSAATLSEPDAAHEASLDDMDGELQVAEPAANRNRTRAEESRKESVAKDRHTTERLEAAEEEESGEEEGADEATEAERQRVRPDLRREQQVKAQPLRDRMDAQGPEKNARRKDYR